MPRVLITGAAGVVGHFLLRRLRDAGFEVHALSRCPRTGAGVIWHRGDLQTGGWERGLPPVEAMIHAAPLWFLPQNLPALRQIGVSRLIAFSSTSRYTKSGSDSPAEQKTALALAEAEDRLAQAEDFAQWTVLRPTLVYGAGLDRNVSAIARFIRRFGFFPLAGDAPGLRQPVHADDLAAVCVALIARPDAAGRFLDLTGGETLTYHDMVLRVFAALGRTPRIVSLPPGMLRLFASAAIRWGFLKHADSAMVDRMAQDMVFDSTPARSLIGYDPRPFHPTRGDIGSGS